MVSCFFRYSSSDAFRHSSANSAFATNFDKNELRSNPSSCAPVQAQTGPCPQHPNAPARSIPHFIDNRREPDSPGRLPRRGHQCWFLSCVVHSFGSMFCPQCKAEYRPGFTRCSDCEVDLVEHLAESNDSTVSSSGATKRVWLCDDQESCVDVCSGLKAAGIPFRVAQRRKQVFWRVDEHYEVWVPAAFYDRAKIIAEKGCFDFSDSDEDQRIMELPDADTSAVKREVRDWGWRPEDATVEVWSGGTELKGVAWMVEASLHEHGIRTHADVTQEGFQRIFVRPEDEHEAREIMHEIKNGTPPT